VPSQVAEPRALTAHERELIRWMLEHGPAGAEVFLSQLARARVASGCNCGCASINLEVDGFPSPTGGLRVLAGFVYGNEDSLCGAFVFEQNGVLAGVEVYGLGTENPVVLPSTTDLRPFEAELEATVSHPSR
jgi:hypothetical protein